jgi:hypothetical protein
VDQLISQDINLTNQCSTLFNSALPQLNPNGFDFQKTEMFKAGLRQKVAIIEAP